MEQKWQVYHISRQKAGFNQSALQVSSFLASSPLKSGESQIDNSVKGDGTISLVRTLRQCITSVDARFNGFGHLRSTGLLHSTSHLTGEPGHETGAFNVFWPPAAFRPCGTTAGQSHPRAVVCARTLPPAPKGGISFLHRRRI